MSGRARSTASRARARFLLIAVVATLLARSGPPAIAAVPAPFVGQSVWLAQVPAGATASMLAGEIGAAGVGTVLVVAAALAHTYAWAAIYGRPIVPVGQL